MMRPLKIKPYDAPRKPQSEAQRLATQRNFHTMRIRALWTLAYVLSPARREAVQAIIDDELRERRAEPHGDRVRREQEEQEERWRRRADGRETPDDLDKPFTIPF